MVCNTVNFMQELTRDFLETTSTKQNFVRNPTLYL